MKSHCHVGQMTGLSGTGQHTFSPPPKGPLSFHFLFHCYECSCSPSHSNTSILVKHRGDHSSKFLGPATLQRGKSHVILLSDMPTKTKCHIWIRHKTGWSSCSFWKLGYLCFLFFFNFSLAASCYRWFVTCRLLGFSDNSGMHFCCASIFNVGTVSMLLIESTFLIPASSCLFCCILHKMKSPVCLLHYPYSFCSSA